MTTLSDRQNSGLYSGLANNAVFAVVMISVGITVFESLRRVRGKTDRPDVRGTDVGGPLGSPETWELGYLYQARSWSKRPPKPIPKWPLLWIKDALMFPEHKLPEQTGGLDGVVYVRFLTAAWFFSLLHLLTTVPILLPIHLIFNPSLPWDSLNRASLQYLSTSDSFLWTHLVMLYWICFTWQGALIWLTRGALRYRREMLCRTCDVALKTRNDVPEEHRGWRFRSIMIENIPDYMRSDQALKDYFERYLAKSTLRSAYLRRGWWGWWGIVVNRFRNLDQMLDDQDAQEKGERPRVVKIVLARKASELQALCLQREVVLRKLETLHVKLAQNVLNAVTGRMQDTNLLPAFLTPASRRKAAGHEQPKQEKASTASLDVLVGKLGPCLQTLWKENKTWDTFPPPLQEQTNVWKLLYDLPPELLHPYQPLVRLKPRYAGRLDVAIDYWALKLATISKRIEEERLVDDAQRLPASTAFVTFDEPRYARKAVQYLAFHPRAPDTCFVTAAPDPSDINWSKVMQSSFRGAFVRDFAVSVGIWFFTLIWVIPVTVIVGLFSITNISSLFPALANYFASNPAKESLISSFLPTLLVSILVILMPTLFMFIYSHINTMLTASRINDMVLSRYWKFLVCNTVFFFSLGVSSIASFVNAFQEPLALLPVVAREFSAAAPFYVGWFVFQTGMHFGLAISLTGLPVWLYPLVRSASTLRRRAEAKRPRNYDYSYWLPTQLLIILIVHVFAILNPLVIPFCFIYLSFENVVYKHQFIYVFSRAFETNGYRINLRVLRYSCDGLIFAQAIFLVLMILLAKIPEAVLTGLLILYTIFAKLYLTRKVKDAYALADEAEADLLCLSSSLDGLFANEPKQLAERPTSQSQTLSRARWTRRLSKFWKTFPFDVDFSHDKLRQYYRERSDQQETEPAGEVADNVPSQPAPATQSEPHAVQPFEFSITQGQFAPSVARPVQDQSKTGEVIADVKKFEVFEGHTMVSDVDIVRQHAPAPVWDDSPRFDGVYDNPFYTKPLDDFLWLPRNPLRSLDLDDSVDVYFALLSRPEEGWRGVGRMSEDVESRVLGDGDPDQSRASGTMDGSPSAKSMAAQPLLGSHLPGSPGAPHVHDVDADLPPIIAARVEHIKGEKDVEDVDPSAIGDLLRRPSMLKRRSSSTTKAPLAPSRPVRSLSGGETSGQPTAGAVQEAHGDDDDRASVTLDMPPATERSRRLSSFHALAQQVLEETRQEKLEREKKQKKTDAPHPSQPEQLASLLDSHGRLR